MLPSVHVALSYYHILVMLFKVIHKKLNLKFEIEKNESKLWIRDQRPMKQKEIIIENGLFWN